MDALQQSLPCLADRKRIAERLGREYTWPSSELPEPELTRSNVTVHGGLVDTGTDKTRC